MKLNIKRWFLGDEKENYSQILKKFGRIGQLEEKYERLLKIIQALHTVQNKQATRIAKLEAKKKGTDKNG